MKGGVFPSSPTLEFVSVLSFPKIFYSITKTLKIVRAAFAFQMNFHFSCAFKIIFLAKSFYTISFFIVKEWFL